MAETVGSLVDKITIVKLKQWHCDTSLKEASLKKQEKDLILEMDSLVLSAISQNVKIENLKFDSNKVYKKEGNNVRLFEGGFADSVSNLSNINCELWHEQEKIYDFSSIPVENKDEVVNSIAILNLERTKLIEKIDNEFILLLNKNKE